MKLPLSWLKEYVDVSLAPERLAEALTMSGTKIESVENGVLEIEVTTNRPDCLSILGLAREVAALTKKRAREPRVSLADPRTKARRFPVRIEDRRGCPYYTARVLEGVSVRPAPRTAQDHLALVGTRAINNAVDATNYVLFETGQPLHAFDLDKLRGGIVVRRARQGEKFLGIDGIEHTLDGETLVIADDSGPVAIAGVIGGKKTEVTQATRNILLESAYFDPRTVRRASRHYKISTESSYRFERGVDIFRVDWASRRAATLILEWGGGALKGGGSSGAPPKAAATPVRLRLARLNRVLGTSVPAARIVSILNSLGFRAKRSGAEGVTSVSPSFRRDVTQEADLIEEVLRIEGFEKIPTLVPPTSYTERYLQDRLTQLPKERVPQIKRDLAAQGFQEIITYSLLSGRALTDSSFDLARYAANRIANAVSAEQEYLRPSLLPGALQALVHNVHRKAASARFFEIGKCYREGRERRAAGLLLYGGIEQNWRRKTDASFFELKGAVGNLAEFLGLDGVTLGMPDARSTCTRYANRAELSAGGRSIGFAAAVHPSVLKSWDIPGETFFAEIDLDAALEIARSREPLRARPVPKFPSVRRDIAFISQEKVPVAALETTILGAGRPYLKEARLFDQFTGKNIPSGKRSLAFSLAYQKETGTFTDDEITALQTRVGEALKNEHAVEFR